MAQQIDLTPATGAPFLHVHVPSGQSASVVNNPADIPAVAPNVGTGTGSKAVTVKVSGVRLSNPS